MTKFLIRVVQVATPQNKNFAGKTVTSYYGKDQRLLASNDPYSMLESVPSKQAANVHGYSRKCDAARSWVYRNPENTEFWVSHTEIIPFDF